MARAGYCSECASNVWLKDDGSCPRGHDASCVSGVYEANPTPPPASVPATTRKSKKWPFAVAGVIVLLVMCGLVSNAAKNSGSTAPQQSAATSTSSGAASSAGSATAQAPAPAPEKPKVIGFAAGMYKVGTDLPAGEYVLQVEAGVAYFQIAKDSTGGLESIIANDNFSNRSIVTVQTGQYLSVNGARIIPVDQATKVAPVNGMLPEGMYKVGTDIAPGEYKVVADGDGYIEVAKDSGHTLGSIVSNDNFQGEKYITVSAGQYLKLSSASLKVQ